jgi:monoamine oxidase
MSFLQDQLVEANLWDRYSQPYSIGAYALFAPAQFPDVLPPLMRPSGNGRQITAGEATCSGNAWVFGALNTAYRAVMEVLAVGGRADLIEKMIKTWRPVDEM